MEPIASGTTTERIVRTTLLAVLFTVGSALFFKDGLSGYPHENMATTIKALGATMPDPPPVIHEAIEPGAEQRVRSGELLSDALAKYEGEPFVHDVEGGEKVHIFFGPGGNVQIRSRGLMVTSVQWVAGPKHVGASLMTQIVIGVLTGVVALVAWIHLIRVLTTRISLTDEGLHVRGKPLVPWDAMKRIDAAKYDKKGWLHLEYELDGRPGRVRLDNYWHKAFRPIVNTICERKGFDYELPPPRRPASGQPPASGSGEPPVAT